MVVAIQLLLQNGPKLPNSRIFGITDFFVINSMLNLPGEWEEQLLKKLCWKKNRWLKCPKNGFIYFEFPTVHNFSPTLGDFNRNTNTIRTNDKNWILRGLDVIKKYSLIFDLRYIRGGKKY